MKKGVFSSFFPFSDETLFLFASNSFKIDLGGEKMGKIRKVQCPRLPFYFDSHPNCACRPIDALPVVKLLDLTETAWQNQDMSPIP